MPYLHGVYTSESPTSVVPSVNAASCLPFVIGTAPADYEGDTLVRCRTWQEFKSNFGAAESYTGADPSTLCAFARQWFKRAGASDALFYAFNPGSSGPGSQDEPLESFENCQLVLNNDYDLHDEKVVCDGDGIEIESVEGATYYYSPEFPQIYFRIATVNVGGTDKNIIVTSSEFDSIIGEEAFTLQAFEDYQSAGALQNCTCSEETAEGNGYVVLDNNGNTAQPITGVDNYQPVLSDGRYCYLYNSEYDGSPCIAIHVPMEVNPSDLAFDVVGLSPAGSSAGGGVSDALAALDTVYEQFGLVVTVVLCPRYGKDYATDIAAKVQKFGSGWSAIALIDIPYNWGSGTPTLPIKSSYITYCSPRCSAGDEIVDASCVVAGAMAATDASAGGFPYVSPSNKLAYIDGVVEDTIAAHPLFLSQPDVNDLFNANAVVSFLHNDKGWVVWGNNTGYYSQSATDPKDRWISVRRTFCYVRNDFLVFGSSRIDNPINKRQLDGVINAYNQRLKGLVGVGAVNSARIALSDQNTAETLLGGAVYVDVFISPPPPMEQLSATFEYDVEGFVSSLS